MNVYEVVGPLGLYGCSWPLLRQWGNLPESSLLRIYVWIHDNGGCPAAVLENPIAECVNDKWLRNIFPCLVNHAIIGPVFVSLNKKLRDHEHGRLQLVSYTTSVTGEFFMLPSNRNFCRSRWKFLFACLYPATASIEIATYLTQLYLDLFFRRVWFIGNTNMQYFKIYFLYCTLKSEQSCEWVMELIGIQERIRLERTWWWRYSFWSLFSQSELALPFP